VTDPDLGADPVPTEEWVLAYLHARPAMREHLRDALRHAQSHPGAFDHWTSRVFRRHLDRMVMDGLLDRLSGGRYIFRDFPAALRGYLRYEGELRQVRETRDRAPLSPAAEIVAPVGVPRDLFSEVIGYDSVKRQILMALSAKEPVHVLLHGPPATAKSLFMEGLATLPGAVYRFADAIRRAGLRRYLIDEKPPYLVIDELEKFGEDEDTALLEFMERQRVSMMVTGQNRDEAVTIRVFAAANKTEKMRPELLSRFHRIPLKEYTKEEFRMVAREYLRKRGTAADVAAVVADGVADRTRDIRDCRRIAAMSRTEGDVVFLLNQLGREARVV
jgi:holliday junction DNA helicase RuvB